MPVRGRAGGGGTEDRLEAAQPWRRVLRPALRIAGDHVLPDALPLPLRLLRPLRVKVRVTSVR